MCGYLDAYEGLIDVSYECVGLCKLRVQLHASEVRLRDGGHSGESFNAATATNVCVYRAVWSQYERWELRVMEKRL